MNDDTEVRRVPSRQPNTHPLGLGNPGDLLSGHGSLPPLCLDADTGLVDESVLDSIVEQYEAEAGHAQDSLEAGPSIPSDEELDSLSRKSETAAAGLAYPVAGAVPDRPEQVVELFGAFAIKYLIFEVHIRINPGAAADPATFSHIQQVAEDVGIPVTNRDALHEALLAHPGQWIKMADLPEPLPGRVNFFVSPDQLRAYMVAASTDAHGSLSILDIDKAADQNGIRMGLDRDMASRVVRSRLFGQLALLATGLPPTPGQDAEIRYHFENTSTLSPAVLETGAVDFKSLNRIPVVRHGDCLASRIPPTDGVKGISVYGRPVPADPGRDIALKPTAHTHVSEDGYRLYADLDGQVLFKDGAVHVETIFFVDGDVDYSTGNIDFNGMVAVRGFVRDGFEVRADGDIIIEGGVEGAVVESRGGDISIMLGVQGAGRAEVLAAGHVRAKYITQATVRAGGDVAVQESIMHCSISARGRVGALGPRGSLVGGTIRAGESVAARFLGSEAHVKTFITLEKIHPASGEPVRLVLTRQKAKVSNALDKALALIRSLRGRLDSTGPHPDLVQDIRDNAARARALKDLLRKLTDEIIRFQYDCAPGGARTVRADQAAYPGVRLTIEGAPFHVMTRYKRIIFGCDENGRIVAG